MDAIRRSALEGWDGSNLTFPLTDRQWLAREELVEDKRRGTLFYTDGSRRLTTGIAGESVYAQKPRTELHSPYGCTTTVFQVEVLAVTYPAVQS